MAAVRTALDRLRRAWGSLAPEQRLAAMASCALLASMFLPWYQKNVVVRNDLKTDSITAFAVLSFVEAAIFLVAAAVLALLFFRGERRAFHLPGGDGMVVFAGGLWAAVLLFFRVFSRPDVQGVGGTVGIQWGFFIAFLAAGGLAYAGWRMRQVDRAEPTAAQDPTTRVEPTPLPAMTRSSPASASPVRATTRRRSAATDDRTRIAGQLAFGEDEDPPDEAPARPSWESERGRRAWEDPPPPPRR